MKIFVIGAVSAVKESQLEKYKLYKRILTQNIKDLVLISPEEIWQIREAYDINNPGIRKINLDEKMVKFDLDQVRDSDLIICDLSELSTGMGIELGVAVEHNKRVMFFYEKGSYVSNMVTGSFPYSKFIEYEDEKDLERVLKKEISQL